MSLASRIAARSRRPTATVFLGGRRWRDVLSLSRDQAFGQGVSGGQVVGRVPPVTIVEGETTISWSWGYDGYEVAGFTGVVTRVLEQSYPNRVTLQVADELWRADIRRSDIQTDPLNEIAAKDAVAQILAAAGVPRVSIATLPAAGSAWAGAEWVLGTLTPVSFPNTTPLAAAQQICEALGYWLFCDAGGVVRAVAIERRPSSSPFRTLRYGVDFLLAGPPDRTRDASTVKNRVVVRGANTGVQGAQIRDEFQTGAADRSLEYSNPLIEYVNPSEAGAASAGAVAQRILSVWSRKPQVIRVPRLKADPRLQVGQTVAVQCDLIGLGSATPFFIYEVSTTLDLQAGDFAQSLTLDGGTGSSGYTTLPPPLASFSWRLVRETLGGVGVVELFLDGTSSTSLGDGEIVSWAWSTPTATALSWPTTATGPAAMFVFPAATTSAEITLTVTDTSSKQGTLTQTVSLAGDAIAQPETRVISAALGAAWAVSPDGGTTWNVEASGDSTLTPEFAGDQLLSTRATGSTGLRGTANALATASEALASLGGQITALSQTRGAPLRVWAAVGADVYRSTDGGATFTTWGTLPATVVAILEDPALFDSVFALAGADMYQSLGATPSWLVFYPGPAGATARHLVRGLSGATTWICYTGTFSGSPLHRVEGPITVAFPAASPDATEIRAIALSDDELSLYAWDQEGRIWAVDPDGTAALTASAHPAGETVQHALHDPDDPIVYVASFGEPQGSLRKYFPLADNLQLFYEPAAGQQAHRVGIADGLTAGAEVLIPTAGATPGGVWHYDGGFWQLRNSGLPAGWTWRDLAVSPFDPNDWLLAGSSGSSYTRSGGLITSAGQPILYRTRDAGQTWVGVDISDLSASGAFAGIFVGRTGYLSDGSLYLYTGFGSGSSTTVALWRGDDNGLDGVALTGSGSNGSHGSAAGQDGDLVIAIRSGGSTSNFYGYVERDASTFTQVGDQPVNGGSAIAVLSTSRGIVLGLDTFAATADYRAGPLGAAVTIDGERIVVAAGVAYLGVGRQGVYAIPVPLSSLAGAVVAADGVTVNAIAADPGQQGSVAALTGDASAVTVWATVDGGQEWVSFAGPGGGSLAHTVVAIVRRTT